MNKEKLENIIVIKRDGKKVSFDGTKIAVAIKKAFDSVETNYTEEDINKVYEDVIQKILKWEKDKIKIEEIQDLIEISLKENNYHDIFQSFSEYRIKRAQSREIFFDEKRKHKFLKALEKIGLSAKEEESNITNFRSSRENLVTYGKTVSEEFATSYLIKKRFSDAHENGDIFIHKIEHYPMGTTENIQMDLDKLFTNGFSTEKSQMREPNGIMSYAILAIVALVNNQNEQSGEQSIPAFDYYMAKGVLKTFRKEFRESIYEILEYTDYDKFIAINGIEREIDKLNTVNFNIEDFYKFTRDSETLKRMLRITYQRALNKTKNAVEQSMEAFVHDTNSLSNSVVTVNVGTDTSYEGRLITKGLLDSVKNGVGENKEALMPKIIFKVKKGVNYAEKDPNHDLLEYAVDLVSSIRNISFSFLDNQENLEFYKEGDYNTEIAYFADGSRVIDNVIDSYKAISISRGVLSGTTINLPRIALKHVNNLPEFYEELDQKLELVKDQLLERKEIQESKKAANFPFLIGQQVWIDSERLLHQDDRLRRVLKQGSMQVGFTGLEDTVNIICPKEKDDKKRKVAVEIVKHLRSKTDEYCSRYNENFILFADTCKEVAERFLEFDRVIFGRLPEIKDRNSYSIGNSLNDCKSEKEKIKNEAALQEFTNGGHKTIIESHDPKETLKEMFEQNIGYGEIIKI